MIKKEKKSKKLPLLVVYFLGFILSVATALPAYLQSNFLGQFVSIKMVSLFFIVANIVAILSITFSPN